MDILSRLPGKSLLRFKCVSKPFCSLIDSPELIKLHLNRSMETKSNLSLILIGWDTTKILSKRLDLLGNDLLDNVRQLENPFQNSMSLTPIVGSCNGLLAIQECNGPIALWKPSTNKHQILPRFWNSDTEYPERHVTHGFGYDISSDDYKVVRIVCSNRVGDDKYNDVRVYSLKTNSWRKIKDFPFSFYIFQCTRALVGGALHWLVIAPLEGDEEEDNEFILAFDLKSEEFRRVQLPHVKDYKYFDEVHVFRGCLSVFCAQVQDGYGGPSNIWILDENGVEESWTKLFTYPQPKLGNFLRC